MDEIKLGEFILTKFYSLYIPRHRMIAMSDFHIGFEEVMAQKGLLLPKLQKKRIMDLFEKIFQYYDVEKILIDGDFKHEFSKNVKQEWDEIEYILKFLTKKAELIIVRGNHDNYLQTILSKYNIQMHRFYKINDLTFIHGDKEFEGKNLIIGHEHPSIKLRDSIGGITSMPTFLYNEKLIVLPSPSIYSSGSDILVGDILSPILRNENIDNMYSYAIDDKLGIIELGKIKYLKNLENKF